MADRFEVVPDGENGWRVEVSARVVFVVHDVGSERSGRLASITPILHGTTHASDRVKLAEEQGRQKYLNKLRGKTSVLIPANAENALDAICKSARHVEEQTAVAATTKAKSAPSQATQLVQLAQDSGIELFHTPDHHAYLTVPINGHRETYSLTGRPAKDWLAKTFYDQMHSAANASALTDALTALAGQAKYDSPEHPVHVRLAPYDEAIYLDLGDATWRTVRITADGWSVVDRPPVYFRRTKGILPLPVPDVGGSIDALRPFVNVKDDDDFILAVNWLVAALRPAGPYPELNITGEQGSAKSTTARVLRSLVDPNSTPLRAVPRDERDLMIAATNAHLCAFDNLSKIPKWLSDALCRLATGGGFSTRQLYTDDETLFDAMRPVLFTAITDVATEGDLADRTIAVTAPVIADHRRRTERELWTAFDREKAGILGALLTAVSVGLKHIATTTIPQPPRMADFAYWGVAAESAFPWPRGRFLDAFVANRRGLVDAVLDGNHLADLAQKIAPWEGTAAALLARLNQEVPEHDRPRGWYGRPRELSDELTRLAPLLRRVGLDVLRPQRTAKKRLIVLERHQVGHEHDDGDADRDATVSGDDAGSSKNGRNDADDADDAALPTFQVRGGANARVEVGEL